MKIKRKKPTTKKVLSTCCWCGQRIGPNQEIFSVGARKNPHVDISKYEGGVMSVKVTSKKKPLWAIVPPAGSDAQRAGNDIAFVLCSETCGYELREALQHDKELGDMFFPYI